MEFQNKVVLITGAGSGIGRVTAHAFAKEGATVVVSDINEEGGKETVAQIASMSNSEAVFIKCNVTKFEEVENLINSTVAQFGRIDVAINNAGIGTLPAKTTETSLENWDKTMAVNATGVFYCMKLELKQMMQQGGGVIVNTASIAGLRGLPNNIAYVASKHAVVGMTKTAAMEYAPHNIRINALCPVFTVTPMFNPEMMEKISAGLPKKLKAHIPMKRFADAVEMANTMLWLCSDKSSFVTGHAMPVDGGL
ncbi:MAG: SDR family NAD(P)-dependent oxidoreductase, partial [Chitinophagales bacterium]